MKHVLYIFSRVVMVAGVRNKIDPQDLLRLVDILFVIKALARLKGLTSSGRKGNYIALCPFHPERTPSFRIYVDFQSYYCYGCGAHGNAISFVGEYCNSLSPLMKLAKLAVKKKWCTWKQIRGTSPSSIVPEDEWRLREYSVPSYYVARGCPSEDRYPPYTPEDFPDYQ